MKSFGAWLCQPSRTENPNSCLRHDRVDTTRGMDITIVTTARTNAEGKALLDAFGFPFKREGQQ